MELIISSYYSHGVNAVKQGLITHDEKQSPDWLKRELALSLHSLRGFLAKAQLTGVYTRLFTVSKQVQL